MKTAKWNGAIIAQSDDTKVIEGNYYFPQESLNKEYFSETDAKSTCPWKGQASYFNVEVDGKTNSEAAWTYKTPSERAESIKDHFAFWKGVVVE